MLTPLLFQVSLEVLDGMHGVHDMKYFFGSIVALNI